MEFIIHLARHANHLEGVKDHPAVREMVSYIKENYKGKIRLSDLSDLVHLDPAYVSGLFKKHTGWSISDFIKEQRLRWPVSFYWKRTKKSWTISL